ncbi:hypothetical protein LP52_11420 [Streptomonospora alba]|uniref:Uncharacterized protein n=1 Tax=Streptomonospora alba TaxID=183763 RepID=A0A0C2FHJ1_9ACTN|nr:hypothetical protein LP52_11420 [Streptomonospora alba]
MVPFGAAGVGGLVGIVVAELVVASGAELIAGVVVGAIFLAVGCDPVQRVVGRFTVFAVDG